MTSLLRRLFDRLRASRITRLARSTFRAYEAEGAVAATFRARQLHAVIRLTPPLH